MPEEQKYLPRTFLTCKRCGYRWQTRGKNTHPPKNCPACCSPYWDKDKTRHMSFKAKYRGEVVTQPVTHALTQTYPEPELTSGDTK